MNPEDISRFQEQDAGAAHLMLCFIGDVMCTI